MNLKIHEMQIPHNPRGKQLVSLPGQIPTDQKNDTSSLVKTSALEITLLGKTGVIVKTLSRRYLSRFLLEAEIKLILTIIICRIKRELRIQPHLSCNGFISETQIEKLTCIQPRCSS